MPNIILLHWVQIKITVSNNFMEIQIGGKWGGGGGGLKQFWKIKVEGGGGRGQKAVPSVKGV